MKGEIAMKRILAALAALAVMGASVLSVSAVDPQRGERNYISPNAKPQEERTDKDGKKDSGDSKTSPNTGYIMAEAGAIAAVVTFSAAGIVLSKKEK